MITEHNQKIITEVYNKRHLLLEYLISKDKSNNFYPLLIINDTISYPVGYFEFEVLHSLRVIQGNFVSADVRLKFIEDNNNYCINTTLAFYYNNYIDGVIKPGSKLYALVKYNNSFKSFSCIHGISTYNFINRLPNNYDNNYFKYMIDFNKYQHNILNDNKKIMLGLIITDTPKVYKSIATTTNNTDEFKIYSKKEIDDIKSDIDLTHEIETINRYNSSNGSNNFKLHKQSGKRLKVKNESKFYIKSKNSKFYKTKYFRVTDGEETSYNKYYNCSLRDIVNKYIYEEVNLLNILGEYKLYMRRNLKPETINFERTPIGKRTTVSLFYEINSNTHKIESHNLYYEDGEICTTCIIDSKGRLINEL